MKDFGKVNYSYGILRHDIVAYFASFGFKYIPKIVQKRLLKNSIKIFNDYTKKGIRHPSLWI